MNVYMIHSLNCDTLFVLVPMQVVVQITEMVRKNLKSYVS